MMLFRRALPYAQEGGAKAAVLNHSPIVGFPNWIDCPGIRFGRSVPLVPPLTSHVLPTIRGVNGSPEANVQSPLHCQSPKTARSISMDEPLPLRKRLSCPNGSSAK